MKLTQVFLVIVAIVLNSIAYKANANIVESNYENAATAFAQNNVNDAFIFVKKALQENPEHLPSKLLISKIFFDAGNLPAVEEELYEALDLGADINLILPVLGSALIIQKKAQALLELEKYQIKFNRQSEFEWTLLMGQLALLNQDKYKAQIQFERALTILPSNTRSLNSLAMLYMGFGWQEKAEKLIAQSLKINPHNEKTLVLKAEIYLAENKLDLALPLLNQAFEIDSQDPKTLRNLALLHLRMQDYTQVKKYTDLILAQSPLDPAATLISAWRMMLVDDIALAEQSLAQLSSSLSLLDEKQVSTDKLTSFVQGASEYLQGNNEKARQYLLSHLNSFPGDKSALRILFEISENDDEIDKLIPLLESKTNNIAEDLYLGTKLVQFHLSKNEILKADSLLNQIALVYPQHAFVIYLQAKIERVRNNPNEALALLNKHEFTQPPPLYYLLLKGELQLELNDLTSALETVELIQTSKHVNIDAYNFSAAVYIKNTQLTDATDSIEKVIALEPKNVTARYNKALVLQAQGKIEEFKSIINKILLENPQHTASLLIMARHELSLGNTEQVIAFTDTILLYDNRNKLAVELQFTAHLRDNNNSSALESINKLLKLDRLNPTYIVAKIKILTELEQYEEADRGMSIVYSLWNNESDKLLYLSELQTNAKFYENALKTLLRVKELTPKSLPVELALANNYLLLKNNEKVRKAITSIDRTFGKSAELYLLKGNLEMLSHNNTKAFDFYAKSIGLKPSNPQAIIKLYQLNKTEHENEQFFKILENLLLEQDTPPWVRRMLADAYLGQNHLALAQQHYETLISSEALSKEPQILNNLANIYAVNNIDKALETAKKGLEYGSKNPSLLDTIGWLLAQQKKYDEALPFLRDAFIMNASSSTIKYHLGFTLNGLGRTEEAINELKAALMNTTDFSEYEEAKTLLDLLQLK